VIICEAVSVNHLSCWL